MKNLVETLKYLGKNLILILGFAILPACFIGGLLQPFTIFHFMVDYKNMAIFNFGDILTPLFGMSWMSVINWILALIILMLILAAFLGNIENHFRSGKLNLSSTMNFINNTLLIVIVYTAIFLIGYIIYKFLLGLLIFILHIVFGRLGLTPTTLLNIIVVVVSFVTLFFAGYLFSYILLALPDTNICGYSIRTSFSDAADLLNKRVWQTLFLVALPYSIVIPLVVLGHVFGFETVSNILGLTILFMYLPVLSYTLYFDYSRISRYDNIKKYYY